MENDDINVTDTIIDIDIWKVILIDLLGMLAVFLLIKEIQNNYGSGNLSQSLYRFRESYSSGYVDISTIVSILRMETIASGYLAIYVVINNWTKKYRRKRDVFCS